MIDLQTSSSSSLLLHFIFIKSKSFIDVLCSWLVKFMLPLEPMFFLTRAEKKCGWWFLVYPLKKHFIQPNRGGILLWKCCYIGGSHKALSWQQQLIHFMIFLTLQGGHKLTVCTLLASTRPENFIKEIWARPIKGPTIVWLSRLWHSMVLWLPARVGF